MSKINFKFQILNFKFRSGFTLIEFMVAMTLVAILSGLAMTNFMGSQRRGRDVRRQADLNQYRVALENYASTNSGIYPSASEGSGDSGGTGIFSPSGPLSSYLTGYPTGPQGDKYYYRANTSGLDWVLRACVEVDKSVYELCSNGKVGVVKGSNCNVIATLTAACSL